ncbi:MAG: site-specific DNA-methyltransferase [Actinomycetota bacterium]|nr:site-specific DNA-methyltransferase [Actinomycetota bacterium]
MSGPVIDPFCGSGTTLGEAQRRGLPATGVDLNPIACLIARVRTGRWDKGDGAKGLHHAREIRERALAARSSTGVANRIPRIDHWFAPEIQRALAGAVSYLGEVEPDWYDRVALSLSASIVRISRQESDTRYAAIEKRVTQEQAATELSQAMVRICDWLALREVPRPNARVEVRCQNAQDLSNLKAEHCAAAIFSPPYPNAYEYWLYHKYRMYWLGFDPIAVREEELGARPHYCKPNGLTEDDFAAQMGDVFKGLSRCLRPSAPVVVVIGDSVIGGRTVDNGRLILDVAAGQGFTALAQSKRTIRRRRSSFNSTHGHGRLEEHVLLLRRAR